METVNIAKYEKCMKVEYPDRIHIGNADLEGMWIDKDSFDLDSNCPEAFRVETAELIPMQRHYLRGKVWYKGEAYVFTSKVDLRFFDNDDYHQLLKYVFAEIKKEP